MLFGESQSRVIISCEPEKLQQVLSEAKGHHIDVNRIGTVTGDRLLQIGSIVNLSVIEPLYAYNKSIELRMPIEEE